MGITQNIVSIVSEKAGYSKVSKVVLKIGKLSAVMPEAIRFCFDVCTKNTVLDGAELEIREIGFGFMPSLRSGNCTQNPGR